jgi:L-asparaginase
MHASGSPCVAVFGLGGTIAMTQARGGGVSPVLSASDLLAAVPGLSDLQAELRIRDFRNKPGASLDFADLYELAAAIDEALKDGCVGAVVTQGTDTIEEVAYVLDLLLPTDAPVVVTGAMRNPTMAGADGPANILAAIRVAASLCARGLGCLVVVNDQIHAARWVDKAHTGSPAAFVSPDHGPLGHVIEGNVHIPVQIRRRSPALSPVPRRSAQIGLATIAFGDDGTLIEAIAEQVDGLVVAAFGAGHVPASRAGIPDRRRPSPPSHIQLSRIRTGPAGPGPHQRRPPGSAKSPHPAAPADRLRGRRCPDSGGFRRRRRFVSN